MRAIRLIVVSLMVVSFALPASAASDDPWTFEGGGWGHGVGLSQFGALGQAEEGKTPTQILNFYYKDTRVETMPSDHWTRSHDGLWVGLVSNTPSVTLEGTEGAVTFCQPSDCSHVEQMIAEDEVWKFEIDNTDATQCRLRRKSDPAGPHPNGYGPCSGAILDLTPTDRLKLNSREYGRGTVRFDPSSAGFHAVVTLDLEQYLYGLAEVPSSWPPAALQAQAIIGRSFAVATAVQRGGSDGQTKLGSCGCHLRSTSADQVYAGWLKEDPNNSGAAWKAAVDGTNRKILVHDQSPYAFKIAKAFYSSSNGGASENVEDVWGGAALPWLRSVNDKWSSDPGVNPLASWQVSVSDADMATYFGWERVLDAFYLEGPPGVRVKFTGKVGGKDVSKTLNGSQIASLLRTHGFDYQAVGSSDTRIRVSPYISAVIDPPGFDDIVGHLFEGDIEWAFEEGITKGCNPPANTLFCPGDDVSREVMAAFLNRALNLPAATRDHFSDDNGSIFENDINRLAEAGITRGCGGSNFCPKEVVDRGQMAAFLVRALGLTDSGGGDLFEDDNDSIFEHDIDILGTAGITRGCNPPGNDHFCPDITVDRGAMTAFLHRGVGEK